MTTELLSNLLLWAALLTQQPKPEALPDVQFVDNEFFEVNICDGPCNYLAFYSGEDKGQVSKGTIYIDISLSPIDSVYKSSIVVHELVHYLQDESGAIQSNISCDAYWNNERQAYRAQEIFLRKHRIRTALTRSLEMRKCR